jgi:hypothetical protein
MKTFTNNNNLKNKSSLSFNDSKLKNNAFLSFSDSSKNNLR